MNATASQRQRWPKWLMSVKGGERAFDAIRPAKQFSGRFGGFEMRICMSAALTWLMLTSGLAAAEARPDPATVHIPDVSPSSDPKVRENGFRYHYLHKAGVSYAEAYADFAACERIAWNGLFVPAAVPGFVAWPTGSTAGLKVAEGDVDWARVNGSIDWAKDANARDRRISAIWRCMKPRGYLRYAIPQATWPMIYDPRRGGSLAIEAKLASGPAPSGAQVTE